MTGLLIASGDSPDALTNIAIGLANHFKLSQHQIITHQDNDNSCFDEEYNLPDNLKIIKLPKFGFKNIQFP